MRLQDISGDVALTQSNQDEAIQNIKAAPTFGITPESFRDDRNELMPTYKESLLPKEASPTIARMIASSPEKAAAIAPDAKQYSTIERIWGTVKSSVSATVGDQRRHRDLTFRMLTNRRLGIGELTRDEQDELASLDALSEDNYGAEDYKPSWGEALPGQIIAGAIDMPLSVVRNPKLSAAAIGAPAAVGTFLGGPVAGLAAASWGFLPVMSYDAYQTTTADTYISLSNLRDEMGTPISVPESEKELIAHGTGLVSGSLAFVGGKLLARYSPLLKNIGTSKYLSQLMSRGGDTATREGFKLLGSIASEASEEGLQEFVQIAAEEIGKLQDPTEDKQVLQGIFNAGYKVKNNIDGAATRVGTAAAIGGGIGATVKGVTATAQKAIDVAGKRRGIKPGDAPKKAETQLPKSEVLPFTATDMTPQENVRTSRMDAALDVQGTLEFQTFVDMQSKAVAETGVGKKSPELVAEIRRELGASQNQPYVWFDLDSLRKLADDPIKGEVIRDMIGYDAEATLATENNVPVQVPIEKAMAVHDKMPELSEYIQMRPETMAPNQIEAFVKAREEQQARSKEILEKLKIDTDRDPITRAYDIKLNEGMEDVQLAAMLRTQEVADGYLNRLAAEDMEYTANTDADGLARNNILRERITSLRDSLPSDKSAAETLALALDREVPQLETFTMGDYVNQPSISEALAKISPVKEAERIDAAQREARMKVAENINETAQYEMNKVISEVEAQATQVQAEIEAQKIANDPDIAIVDRFTGTDATWFPTARFKTAAELTANHAKPGYSIFAIDPQTLSDADRKLYTKNKLMKDHKVFVKGGISADDAAELLGVNSGENLLKILSKTPRREDAIEARVAAQKRRLRKESEEAVDLDKTSLRAAYNAKLANNVQEMKLMWDASRSELKAGIKRIAKPLPRKEVFTNQAKDAVRQMPIGKLNANQFKKGERTSRVKAVDAIMKNDLETAFAHKESEALNSELAIETHTAIGKVNRAKKFFARMETSELEAELKFANDGSFEAWREITDTFRLTGSNRGIENSGAFAELVSKAYNLGIADLSIPEKLADPRTHVSELTVEQVLTLEQTGRAILKMAREKNELIKTEGRNPEGMKTLAAQGQDIIDSMKTLPQFDLDRAESKQDMSFTAQFLAAGDELTTLMIKNAEAVAFEGDGEKVGFLNKYIIAPLNGVGDNAGGLLGKAKDMVRLSNTMKEAITKFGVTEFSKLLTVDFDIPEFKDSPRLNRGKLTEGQLLMMLMNMGDKGDRETMAANFGVSLETIQTVLDRHLTERHAVFAQTVMNMFKDLYPRVVDLHQRTKGITPDMVEAEPFSLGGKTYPGGYFPRDYSKEMDYQSMRRASKSIVDSMNNEKRSEIGVFNYADDLTRQGHTMTRTGNDRPINLDIGSLGMHFEAIIHDLNMRAPIANAIRLLTDAEVAKHITAGVGKEGYLTILNMAARAATSTEMQNNALMSSKKNWDRFVTVVRRTHSAASLLYRPASIMIQPTSSIYALERMGNNGPKYVGMVAEAIMSDPMIMWKELGTWAENTLPSLALAGGDLNENQRDPISELMPKRRFKDPFSTFYEKVRKKPAKTVTHAMADFGDLTNQVGFGALGHIDNFQKKLFLAAAYAQFMNGEAEGVDAAAILKMTPEQRDSEAKIYATSVVRQSLTAGSVLDKSEIQHRAPMFAMYFNDTRNALATHLRQMRTMKRAWVNGEYMDSAKVGTIALMHMAAARMFQDLMRGNALPFLDDELDEEEKVNATAKYMATTPLKFASDFPFVRDVAYAATFVDSVKDIPLLANKRNEVTSVHTQTATNILYTAKTIIDFMDSHTGGDEEFAPTRNEVRSTLYGLSLLTGGRIPVNALSDLHKRAENEEFDQYVEPFTKMFDASFKRFEKQQAALPPEERVPEVYVDAARDVRDQLVAAPIATPEGEEPAMTPDRIPNSVYETIGQIESGGRWNAQNPNSSASGVYQFLTGTWRGIMDQAPELGLTEAGRTSKDTTQQQKAMEWFTRDNAKRLARADIDITTESLYAAHFLGAATAIGVLSAPAETKLKTLVSNDVMQANEFAGSMTVRAFKQWVAKKVSRAERQLAKNQGDDVDNEVDN